MRDLRIDKLAAILVGYSTGVKKGDLVRIGGEIGALPLMESIFEECLRAGANPFLQLATDSCAEALFRLGSDEQIAFVNPVTQYMVEKIDVYFGIRGTDNTKAHSNVSAEKQALLSQSRKSIYETLFARTGAKAMRWAGAQFPTPAAAQDAEMSLHEYEDFIFNAALLHLPDPIAGWKAVSEKQQQLVDYLNTKKEIRVIGRGAAGETDLRLNIAGRNWINCDGHVNFPDGEVYTAPLEDSVNGTIRYSFPAIHMGTEVHDIVLKFKDGRVVDASASKGEEFLLGMLDLDAGARTLGEFAVGTNFGIRRYTKNTLFDEKIGGTCHAALGAAYPQSGGINVSALHWDMVFDLRAPGCRLEVDGVPLLSEGRFLHGDWQTLQ